MHNLITKIEKEGIKNTSMDGLFISTKLCKLKNEVKKVKRESKITLRKLI
jgi:hypothetical protein